MFAGWTGGVVVSALASHAKDRDQKFKSRPKQAIQATKLWLVQDSSWNLISEVISGSIPTSVLCLYYQNECELALYQAIINSAWYSPAP